MSEIGSSIVMSKLKRIKELEQEIADTLKDFETVTRKASRNGLHSIHISIPSKWRDEVGLMAGDTILLVKQGSVISVFFPKKTEA